MTLGFQARKNSDSKKIFSITLLKQMILLGKVSSTPNIKQSAEREKQMEGH